MTNSEPENTAQPQRSRRNWEGRWHRDPVSTVAWAAIFIWAGLGLLADTTDWGYNTFSWWSTWAVIMVGAGAILLLSAVARLMMPEHRRSIIGNIILGIVFLGVGLGNLTSIGWVLIVAIALIIVGISIILGNIFHVRH